MLYVCTCQQIKQALKILSFLLFLEWQAKDFQTWCGLRVIGLQCSTGRSLSCVPALGSTWACSSCSDLRASSGVFAVCSTSKLLYVCSMIYRQVVVHVLAVCSTGKQLCACSVFYGQAVVCLQCVLRAGGCVLAVYWASSGVLAVCFTIDIRDYVVSSIYGFTGRRLCACSAFYGQAVVCFRVFYRQVVEYLHLYHAVLCEGVYGHTVEGLHNCILDRPASSKVFEFLNNNYVAS